jgi:hypothetical protein
MALTADVTTVHGSLGMSEHALGIAIAYQH